MYTREQVAEACLKAGLGPKTKDILGFLPHAATADVVDPPGSPTGAGRVFSEEKT